MIKRFYQLFESNEDRDEIQLIMKNFEDSVIRKDGDSGIKWSISSTYNIYKNRDGETIDAFLGLLQPKIYPDYKNSIIINIHSNEFQGIEVMESLSTLMNRLAQIGDFKFSFTSRGLKVVLSNYYKVDDWEERRKEVVDFCHWLIQLDGLDYDWTKSRLVWKLYPEVRRSVVGEKIKEYLTTKGLHHTMSESNTMFQVNNVEFTFFTTGGVEIDSTTDSRYLRNDVNKGIKN